MAGSHSDAIGRFCEALGVAVPPGFHRKPANRWAMIRVDAHPPCLVAVTFDDLHGAQFYLRRELQHSDFGVGSDLPIVALDAENGKLHPITRDCVVDRTRVATFLSTAASSHKPAPANEHVEVVGIHKIDAREPCHLVEILVRHGGGPFDPRGVTQECTDLDPAQWQAPYCATVLDVPGIQIIGDAMRDKKVAAIWTSPTRIAFFFHYLDLSKPLRTPFGEVPLPWPSPLPDRLRIMKYQDVD